MKRTFAGCAVALRALSLTLFAHASTAQSLLGEAATVQQVCAVAAAAFVVVFGIMIIYSSTVFYVN